MGNKSKIEWTDATWNPLAGCTRVSPGCDNCYAASMALRLEAMANAKKKQGDPLKGLAKYQGVATKNGKGVAAFTGKVNVAPDELKTPFKWSKPRRVFVNSMSDLFHKNVPVDFVAEVFDVMRRNERHTFQVLTKRPERIKSVLMECFDQNIPYMPNILVGTSVEDQKRADERLDGLLEVWDYFQLFLSCEPLLGPIDFQDLGHWGGYPLLKSISWVICGGESGPNARPMYPEWAQDLRDQCREADVPFYFKQGSQANWPDYKNFDSFPSELQVREWPNEI